MDPLCCKLQLASLLNKNLMNKWMMDRNPLWTKIDEFAFLVRIPLPIMDKLTDSCVLVSIMHVFGFYVWIYINSELGIHWCFWLIWNFERL